VTFSLISCVIGSSIAGTTHQSAQDVPSRHHIFFSDRDLRRVICGGKPEGVLFGIMLQQ
jgi:hypothetical protein